MRNLSISLSNELWIEYSLWLKNNNQPSNMHQLHKNRKHNIFYNEDYHSSWEPGEREAMSAVAELAMVGSSQCGDDW